MLSPLLYSLFTHDCMAKHDSNIIIKFADDTTVVGLITDSNETAYREEFTELNQTPHIESGRHLVVCPDHRHPPDSLY